MSLPKKLQKVLKLSKKELENKYRFSEEEKYKRIQKLKKKIDNDFEDLIDDILVLLYLYPDTDIMNRLTGTQLSAYRSRIRKYLKTDSDGNNFFDKDIKRELKSALTKRTTIFEAISLEVKALLNIAYHKLEKDFDDTFSEVYKNSFANTISETEKLIDKKTDSKERTVDLEQTWRPNRLNHRDLLWGDMRQLMVTVPKAIKFSKFRNEDITSCVGEIDKLLHQKNRRANRNLDTDAAYFFVLGQKDAFEDLEILTVTFTSCNDSKVCPECQALNGVVIAISELVPYENAPPIHDNCRCFLIPNFNEDWLENL